MIDKIMASLLSLVSFFYFFIADSEKGLIASWVLMGVLLILYLFLDLFSGNPNFFRLYFYFYCPWQFIFPQIVMALHIKFLFLFLLFL